MGFILVGALVVGATLVFLRPIEQAEEAQAAANRAQASVPLVSAMTVDSGSLVAGNELTLTGQNLSTVSTVTFNDVHADDVTVVDNTTVVATVPTVVDYQPATVSVEVFAGEQAVAATAALEYSYAPETAVDHQMQYLFTHWNNYNTAQYGDLNPIGGDCANFVSQSLIARGWTMTDDWYNYDAGNDWADAWGYVPAFDEWIRSHPEYGATQLGLDQRDQVKIGDLAVFDWDNDGSLDHIQVVSSITVVDGVTKIGMVGHNVDTDYRDLDTTITTDHPGATGWFWSIP